MKCGYKMYGGTEIAIDGENVWLKNLIFREHCKLTDIISIRLVPCSFWRHASIDIITHKTIEIMHIAHNKKPVPYSFTFLKHQTALFEQFYQDLLKELRSYHNSEGAFLDGWWTWPEDQASGSAEKANDLSAVEPPEKAAVPPEATPPEAAPALSEAAPPEATAALSEADIERAIQSRMTEEKQKKGPACPECGCTSIFADKDADGVIITCLNCGCQWRPGEHRSW